MGCGGFRVLEFRGFRGSAVGIWDLGFGGFRVLEFRGSYGLRFLRVLGATAGLSLSVFAACMEGLVLGVWRV